MEEELFDKFISSLPFSIEWLSNVPHWNSKWPHRVDFPVGMRRLLVRPKILPVSWVCSTCTIIPKHKLTRAKESNDKISPDPWLPITATLIWFFDLVITLLCSKSSSHSCLLTKYEMLPAPKICIPKYESNESMVTPVQQNCNATNNQNQNVECCRREVEIEPQPLNSKPFPM